MQPYFLFKTVCDKTGQFVLGVHKTIDMYDGFLGTSAKMDESLKVWGKLEHTRHVIQYFNTHRDACQALKRAVKQALLDPMCMNDPLPERKKRVLTEEHKAHLSASMTGRALAAEVVAARIGKKRSQETCEKISKARTGTHHSEETKKKMSEAHIGVSRKVNWILSEETKEKMRQARALYWANKKKSV
jgi:hypothetical protein